MRNITLLFSALAALMAVLGFGTASGGLVDLARILFAAFVALCAISLALSVASAFDEGPRD